MKRVLPQAFDVPLHPGHSRHDDSRPCSAPLVNTHSDELLNILTLNTMPGTHSTHALIQWPTGSYSIQKSQQRLQPVVYVKHLLFRPKPIRETS